jgi:glycosyltransferase involved in cell wall biosynthesis
MNGAKISRGVFVSPQSTVSSAPGGVQICTREYVAALEDSGFALDFVTFEGANGLLDKVLRRIDPRPYRHFLPHDLICRVSQQVKKNDASHVFLNTGDLAPLAAALKFGCPDVTIVLLSIGLESVDYIHTLRTQRWRSDFHGLRRRHELLLGRQLIEECRQRLHLDKVLCLAEFEAEIERWLGAREVMVVPRTITAAPLCWAPVDGRIGFVGRLDHPPNLEGLLLTLDALGLRDTSRIEVRIVGAPDDFGAKLSERYSFVSYRGSLSEDKLVEEAATWTCAINPIFCFARGASTKLAIMVSWGIPVVTTPQGQRGYEWRGGAPIICNSAEAFGDKVWTIATDPAERLAARRQVLKLLEYPLDIKDVGERLRKFLHNRSLDEGSSREATIS